MEKEREKELLFQARYIYSSALGRMPGLEQWADSFKGTEEYSFTQGLYDYISKRNAQVSARVFDIDHLLQEDFLKHLSLNSATH